MRRILTVTMALGLLAMAARLTAQPPEVKPGPEHEALKHEEGAWDATVKMKGGEFKGQAVFKMGLNGLWLLENFKADFGGMKFEGYGATSYDPQKKKYVNVWIDSMATAPMLSEGGFDKETKTLTLTGKMPMPDGKEMPVTMTSVMNDPDTKTFTINGTGPDGKSMEFMQITYKRAAK